MKIHILGICGTFMGGVAVIAREQGHEVSGCDAAVYPPMSDTLRDAGITILEGYKAAHIPKDVDVVIVGNAISRGNPALEYVLNNNVPYTSGPQWLADVGLKGKHVLAVSGTHGKTTTSSVLAWILEASGLNPGYLIGGVAKNFSSTARLGDSKYFVIEADEYDTAFFDKRSKFLHYRPNTLIMNNLEFDHADIFDDLKAIQKQFAFLLRTVPENGLVIRPQKDDALDTVVKMGCWTPIETFGAEGDWQLESVQPDGSSFSFNYQNKTYDVEWSMCGLHNVNNALAAMAAAHHVGISVEDGINALKTFQGIKRRLEIRGEVNGVTVYDDFAHHPTAIKTTLNGLRACVGDQRIVAILQFGSNTMRDGCHDEDAIAKSLEAANQVILLKPEGNWSLDGIKTKLNNS
ncbi:MAG: UDP-N-acetylmuramate:L-alanyl-gamma-D-glutamyl-meso-diaminopimelate ligase, partial [Coxiellaceae bacterium]|nr:UDP-N-acetylmuramate:L-alanyl-gamma-D-glutamyl-meso-diaminopimelate ligase [Coxiellaceae bacterium]